MKDRDWLKYWNEYLAKFVVEEYYRTEMSHIAGDWHFEKGECPDLQNRLCGMDVTYGCGRAYHVEQNITIPKYAGSMQEAVYAGAVHDACMEYELEQAGNVIKAFRHKAGMRYGKKYNGLYIYSLIDMDWIRMNPDGSRIYRMIYDCMDSCGQRIYDFVFIHCISNDWHPSVMYMDFIHDVGMVSIKDIDLRKLWTKLRKVRGRFRNGNEKPQ